jgi:hypothetical protein
MARRDRTARVAGRRRRDGEGAAEAADAVALAAAPSGLTARILAAWGDAWGVARAERLSDPGEPRLLAYAVGGCFALWLARLPDALRDARLGQGPEAGADPTLLVVASLVAMLFFTPLFLYGVAALARMVLGLFGGSAGWREARTAVFWSLLPAAPAFLLGYAAAFLLASAGAPPLAAAAPRIAADVAWLRFWSVGLAEANGFRSAWPIFAVMAALALAFRLAEPGVMASGGAGSG